jgi:putative ABC transport system permease protein
MSLTLLRIGSGHIKGNPLQTILLILGVAIGVSVIVAVDLANRSANRSFQISVESLAGRATHRIVGGPSGLDENLYSRLRVELGLQRVAPIVEDYVTVIELNRRPMRLLGLDPFAESPFRSYITNPKGSIPIEVLNALFIEPNSVLISEDVARSAGLKTGDTLKLEHGPRIVETRIVGLLKPSDEMSRIALGGMVIADISTAQEALNRIGRLSHIDLIIDTDIPTGRLILDRIHRELPPDARIEHAGSRTSAIRGIKSAFELNLFALGLMAVVVGGFLIYNTVTLSVVQRRPILGMLRALGVTRGQIFNMVLLEALVLGTVGTSLGLGLGIVLGSGLVRLVSQTINDLYFTLIIDYFDVSPLALIKGAFIGILTSAVGASIPAWEATRVAPTSVLRRSELEGRVSRVMPWFSFMGLVLAGLGTLSLLLSIHGLQTALAGLLAILLGTAFLIPILIKPIMGISMWLSGRIGGTISRMALRNITRSQSRTVVAIAALMVSVSVIVSIDIMIGSFRKTVINWLDDTLTADIFISAPSTSIGSDKGFDPSISEEVKGFPGISKVLTVRRTGIDTQRYGRIDIVAVSEETAKNRRFIWTEGNPKDIWKSMEEGAVLVSQPFSYRNGIGEGGAIIELPTDKGRRTFKVAGIYQDYTSQMGVVLMSDTIYRRFWNDREITSIAAYTAPGYSVDSVIQGLRTGFAGRYSLIVQSNLSLRLSAIRVFDRTFTITTALRLLVGIVAFIGVFSALMALQLERVREIGILRATGMTVSQVRRMVLLETGFMGITAGLIALPVGSTLAFILAHVINPRSFGWTIEFILSPWYLLEALLIALFAAILAGIYPAFRFGRIQIASAIRME